MENPAGVSVSFYSDVVELKYESEKQGRPIYKEVPFIRKIIHGDQHNVIERAAKENDFKAYPIQWKRYQAENPEDGVTGTPLTEWGVINKAQAKEAAYFHVQTVEQLAQVSDANIMKMGMGWQAIKAKAIAWIESSKTGAIGSAAAAENERLKNDIAALQAQVAEVRKPGRPKKEPVEA